MKVKGYWGSDSFKVKWRRCCFDFIKVFFDLGGWEGLVVFEEGFVLVGEDVDLFFVVEMVVLVE